MVVLTVPLFAGFIAPIDKLYHSKTTRPKNKINLQNYQLGAINTTIVWYKTKPHKIYLIMFIIAKK